MAKKKKKAAKKKPAKKAAKKKAPAKKKPAKKVAKKKPAKKVAKKKVAKKATKKAAKKKAPAKKKVAKAKPKAKAKPVKKAKPAPKAKAKPAPKAKAKAAPAKAKAKIKAAPEPVEKPAVKAPPPKIERRIIETQAPQTPVTHSYDLAFSSDELDEFKDLLRTEKEKILTKARAAVEAGNIQFAKDDLMDEVDQASAMVEQNLNLRLLDRDRKLLWEIDHALGKIETGDFGYCEGTGEPIPKRRLELRPWTRHSVKYKEKLERMKKSGRGVADEDEL